MQGLKMFASPTTEIVYQQGAVSVFLSICVSLSNFYTRADTFTHAHTGCNLDGSYTQDMMDQAVAAARNSDIVVVAVGMRVCLSHFLTRSLILSLTFTHANTGEAPYAEAPGNMNDLNMPLGQRTLINNLHATGKPVVVVLVEGRPLIMGTDIILKVSVCVAVFCFVFIVDWLWCCCWSQVPAIVHALLPGPIGGQAIAEVLLGVCSSVSLFVSHSRVCVHSGLVNPSGRLPVTYPSTHATVPIQYWRTHSHAGLFCSWFFVSLE